jgi:general nucleoside transport system ATP-binding protein
VAQTSAQAGAIAPPAVRLEGIAKRFPGVVANDDVHLEVTAGEIHAIVGENGAGKSTLMKILYGMQRPDEGTIEVDGEEVHFRSPKEAIAAGIGMVHQHFMLAGNLTVLENVVLGLEPRRGPSLDRATARERIQVLSRTQGAAIDPDRLVESLSVGEKQRVEIIKVLYRGARILILDEPTGVLVPQEVDELFAHLRELRAEGVTIIFISHKLHEVLAIADRVTVLRAGRTVRTVAPAEVSSRQLAELMVGSELPTPETRDSTVTEHERLVVDGIELRDDDGRPLLQDISFAIHEGEILGIAGVEGNGQQELVDVILGLRELTAGSVRLAGADVSAWSTRERRGAGLGYIPEDRQLRGLLLPFPLWENVMLGHQSDEPCSRKRPIGRQIDRDGALARTQEVIDEFDVRTPGPEVPAHALSGGNQQKLIVGRELKADPQVLLAAHPTRGIDVGAQASVWEQIREARAAGMAILLISADLEELIGLSDRLQVMFRGTLVAELDPAAVTPDVLGSYMTGAVQERGA